MVNNLNAEALRNALVVASMEYCKKYLEGQNVDKTEDIKAQIAKLEANITIRMYSGKEEARKRQLEDPIVFKANEIGAIIATMWDTEATDSIFDKYR